MTDVNSNGSSELPILPLPARITVSTFTAARIKEIQAMRKCINETSGAKMAFQKLPKHMRRRAMSHVVKRLPRRLREIHINQMKKSGLPPKSKRPTRRYRRRPLNLHSDYDRRQRRIKWLNTHIWHAKRFHMIEKWGCKVPKQPCDKSFRACYRATAQHCLIQDLSYIRCIEITGLYEEIMLKLTKITDAKIGLTFGAKCFYEGRKFGELTVFEPNSNDNGIRKAIGEVQFFWSHKVNEENRILWIFVHPAFYKQLLNMFIDLYALNKIKMEENKEISSYYGDKSIVLRELEYELGKFRLTGPLSTAVLKNALRLVNLEEKFGDLPNWFKNYSTQALSEQNEVFRDLTNASYVPPNTVLSVIVNDPRLNWPKKRTKASLDLFSDYVDFDRLQKNLSLSPLFEDNVRKFVKDNKVSNAELCKLRSKCLIPGLEMSMENESVIPIILLRRPGNKSTANIGYANGWDIIVPSSWSQSFFLSFVMWGARAGGLRETESIAFERSQTDILYPDTAAGEQEENYITEVSREKFFRLPPNKRTNFNRFGIASPFSFNWRVLITDWSGRNCDSFSVIRNRTLLQNLQEFLSSKSSKSVMPPLPDNCLVPVKVTPITKGVCSRFGIICIPTEGNANMEPVEPKHKDVLAQKRKHLRQEHANLLQKLRRSRKRATRLGKPITPTDVDMLHKYKTDMQNLWLPGPKTIRTSCSSPVIGFIKHGDFSFTLGQSKGLGYIVADSLAALGARPQRDKVLIRNSNSRQYNVVDFSMGTKAIDVYYFPPSPPSRATLMLIKALGLDHNIKITNVVAGDHLKPEFLKMNPFHTIPVINDNGWTLYDSHVIMRYLVDQYAKDDSLFPKDPKKGAIVNLRCFFNACHLFPKFVGFHVPTLLHGMTPPEEALKDLEDVLQHLNNFLEGQMYVAGENLTVADFSIICIIATIDACGSIDITQYPNIWLWYQRTKNAMNGFGYEEINQAGANIYGQMYKSKLATLN